MEENRNDQTSESGEGVLTDVARAIGSTLGKVAAAIGGTDEPQAAATGPQHRRQEKVGLVTSDKMTKTVVVRVERLVRHPKYRRYIRRRTKFMAHNEMEAKVGDTVRIVETRPMSARKRWRVVEIVQKAR
ncbi:MAG TPA: 30S ribosomal protein S17 [Blastocatellia bacterium]|jgi:small subunit ribosomal protein S17|nr:30S ribosomal protein S17 [Blastocatellia bacterium]